MVFRSPILRAASKLIERSPYARLSSTHVDKFKSILGTNGVKTDAHALEPLNQDWQKKWQGSSELALFPKTTEQVSEVLAYCNDENLAVVPQGGNTGLVGGSIPIHDEIILSTAKMNKIIGLDSFQGIVTVESGCVLEDISNFLNENGFIMPLDLGAKGSCMIGGNVSTNAGGLRYLRYGSLRGTVLGVEVVLPDGTVLDNISTLRKDNTGYDLKQLFIGGEGTLGVITKVSISTPRKPKSVNLAFVGVESFEKVLDVATRARSELNEILSALEFMDAKSMELVLEHITGSKHPLSDNFPFYMIVETQGSNEQHDQEKLDAFLGSAMDDQAITDGVLAMDQTQFADLWSIRESIALSLVQAGHVFKYDISLPSDKMYSFVDDTRERLQEHGYGDAHVAGYGHLGDSNLHLNVSLPRRDDPENDDHLKVVDVIEPWVFERTSMFKGSISAEHGMGQCKNEYLDLSKEPKMIELMKEIKKLMDPKGILNPYKVLPSSSPSSSSSCQ